MPVIEQDPPEDTTSGQPPVGSEPLTSPLIPPTPNPPATPTEDPRYTKMLEGTVREQNRKLAELEQRIASGVVEPPKPIKTPEEERTAYFNNPQEETRKLIREELQQTTAELTAFVRQLKGQSFVDQLVERAKINPRIQKNWNPRLEAY